jgi:uncharacterized alpha-E superfamily protein
MLSRVVENLYWMTRYLERAENTARLINATTQMLLDLPRGASFGWDVLVKVVGLDAEFGRGYPLADEKSVLRFLISDEKSSGSIISCIRRARENSRTLREILPRLAWERINSTYLFINQRASETASATRRFAILEELIERRQSLIGLLSECMSHDTGYQFVVLGRNIERADMTTRIVDINAAVLVPKQQVIEDPSLALLWMGVLNSLSAYQPYRRHVSVNVRPGEVVNFLIRDPHFPRSVIYCLGEIETSLSELPHNAMPLKVLRTARRRVDQMKIDQMDSMLRHEYLDAVQRDLIGIHREVAREYFHMHLHQTQSATASA